MVEKRIVNVHGKTSRDMLMDPDHQEKMLANRIAERNGIANTVF